MVKILTTIIMLTLILQCQSKVQKSDESKVQINDGSQPISRIFGFGHIYTRDGRLFSDDDCDDDDSCPERYNCLNETKKCHRDSIFPLKLMDYFGLFTLAFLMALAIAAGIGGGEIIVPVIKIMFLFVQDEASTMSQYCIFLACLTRYIVNYNKLHPYRNAVPIDYKIALLLLPSIFIGISFGVMVHNVVPELIQEILLIALLLFCEFEAIKKGITIWRQESAEKQEESSKVEQSEKLKVESQCLKLQNKAITQSKEIDAKDLKKPLLENEDIDNQESIICEETGITPELYQMREMREKLEHRDRSHWQFDKLLPIWFVLAALILQSLIKDTSLFGVRKCSGMFWLVYAIYIILCLAVVVYSVLKLKSDNEYREKIGLSDYKGNVKFPTNKIIFLTGLSVCFGFSSSIIGVGGSLFYIPMLLILGYPPFVASSTSIFLVMNSAFANSITYTIKGDINVYNGLWYGLWTVIGVFFGVTIANKIVQRTGRQSIFLILLALVIIIAITFSVVFNTLDTIKEINDGKSIISVKAFCE